MRFTRELNGQISGTMLDRADDTFRKFPVERKLFVKFSGNEIFDKKALVYKLAGGSDQKKSNTSRF